MNLQEREDFQRFIRGLREHNLTYEELVNNQWRYAGGNGETTSYSDANTRHYRYFKLCFPNMEPLDPVNHCVCGHYIQENCYISDFEGNFIIIGNCCIKKFVPLSSRTCEDCKRPHKNRKINKCNPCRGVKGKVYDYPKEVKQPPKWNWKKWGWTNNCAGLSGIIQVGDVGIQMPIDV